MLSYLEVCRAACMASSVYDMPESTKWKLVPAFGGSGVSVKSIPLQRNLVGKKGSIEVAYYLLDDTLFVAYSGTEDPEYWIYNADTKTAFYKGYTFHHGLFLMALEVYKGIRDELEASVYHDHRSPIKRLIHSGHSAGGAIAGMMPLIFDDYKRHHIVDFGTPRYISTDTDRAYYPYPRLRFQEIYDIVPCIPLRWRGPLPGFRHFGDVVYTTPKHKVIPKLPWYRPAVLAWKYLHSLATEGPIDELRSHHSVLNYLSAVISSYPQEAEL